MAEYKVPLFGDPKLDAPVYKALKQHTARTKDSEDAGKFNPEAFEAFKLRLQDQGVLKKKAGGKVSSASSRADGIASKGKTRGRMV